MDKRSSIYSDNFSFVKKFVSGLNPSDAASFQRSQEVFIGKILQRILNLIKGHFKILLEAITELETSGLFLHDALLVLEKVKNELNCVPVR